MRDIIDCENFYISYNDMQTKSPVSAFIETILQGAPSMTPETAIVYNKDEGKVYLILNGDHRESLRGLSLEDAIAYWRARPLEQSPFSESPK